MITKSLKTVKQRTRRQKKEKTAKPRGKEKWYRAGANWVNNKGKTQRRGRVKERGGRKSN